MIDQALARAVEGPDVLLLQGLLRHEAHVPLLYCCSDRLGVIGIVLLLAYDRLHILWGHGQASLGLESQLSLAAGHNASAEIRCNLVRNAEWVGLFVCQRTND